MPDTTALIGMPGCGKTTIGRHAAAIAGRPFADVDEIIVRTFGPIAALFEHGEEYFRRCETAALQQACALPGAVIATGGGIVVRPQNMEILRQSGIIVFLHRSIETIASDIHWQSRPLLAGGEQALLELYRMRLPLYRQYADHTIQNDGGLDAACQEIVDLLEGKR